MSNPWLNYVLEVRQQNPELSYKECLILAKSSYTTKAEKKVINKSKKMKKDMKEGSMTKREEEEM